MKGDPEVNWFKYITPAVDQGNSYTCGVINILGACEFQFMYDDKRCHQENRNKSVMDYFLSRREIVEKLYQAIPLTPEEIEQDRKSEEKGLIMYDEHGFRLTPLDRILSYLRGWGVSMDADWPWSEKFIKEKPNESCVLWVGNWLEGWLTEEGDWCEEKVNDLLKLQPIVGGFKSYPSFAEYRGGEKDIYRGPTDVERYWEEEEKRREQLKDTRFQIQVVPHIVLIIGYGTDSLTQEKYFLVRNSYGAIWGFQGLGKMLRSLFYYFACPSQISYPREVTMVEEIDVEGMNMEDIDMEDL